MSSEADDGSEESTTGEDPTGAACDAEEQDCPDGFKCVLIQSPTDYGFQCVEVLGTDGVGEPCMHDGLTKGTDTCKEGAFCFGQTDFNGNPWEGRCYGFCSLVDPMSCSPDEQCISAGGVPVCAPSCNPLVGGSCGSEAQCVYRDSTTGFVCFPPATEVSGIGEPCISGITCEAGLACVEGVAGCESQGRCCTELCDVGGDASQCSAADLGATCVSLEVAVPEQQDAGACRVPG